MLKREISVYEFSVFIIGENIGLLQAITVEFISSDINKAMPFAFNAENL